MKQNGFTLIELLVVVAIIGILAAVGVVAQSGYTTSAKNNAVSAGKNFIKDTKEFQNKQWSKEKKKMNEIKKKVIKE